MQFEPLTQEFTVCKAPDFSCVDLTRPFVFLSKTDEECSIVCETGFAPENATHREDGWKAFRAAGILDFSLVGILSKITSVLAENGIPVFAVSTYNTDYVLVKKEDFLKSLALLAVSGQQETAASKENQGA